MIKRHCTTKEFILKATSVHGNRYDYCNAEYSASNLKIRIRCRIHGDFFQRPNNHIQGQGCPQCGIAKQTQPRTFTTNSFIEKANRVHGHKYDYTKAKYINMNKLIDIYCPNHGIFCQTPGNHLKGQNCPLCSHIEGGLKKRLGTSEFIRRSKQIHGNKYQYTLTNYTTSSNPVTIICPNHGPFKQAAQSHLAGNACALCSNSNTSKLEQQWLDSLKLETMVKRQLLVVGNKRYRPDGYDPSTNTVYEFFGDFWHGNPKIYNPNHINPRIKKTYGELNQETIDKIALYKENKYNIVYIWESDFYGGKP